MTRITVAAPQFACTWDREANVAKAVEMVREAAGRGAQVVLLQELFETPYFPKDEKMELFALAAPAREHPTLARMAGLAAELGVVLPVSFFERANNAYYNTLAMIDADGRNLGIYRKSHIPDGPGYEEKFYFNPGDTGFRVFDTRFGRLGPAICWDQWFPEAARALCLQGADLLLYPSAIGSEPYAGGIDTKAVWQRVMQGHAAANTTPVAASNRIGHEEGEAASIGFYGASFVCDHTGAILDEAPRDAEGMAIATLDLEAARIWRAQFGLFRDRRPELYRPLLTLDGGPAPADR